MNNIKVEKVQPYASGAQVRAWAVANGYEVGARGKFSPELIKAYNKNNSLKYVPGKYVRTVVVEGKDSRGRKATRKVSPAAVRAAAIAAGEQVGKRGRIPLSFLAAAAGLTPFEKDVTV